MAGRLCTPPRVLAAHNVQKITSSAVKMATNTALFWFFVTFGVAALAGIASLLRSNKPADVRSCLTVALNSGLFGAGLAMFWYEWWGGAEKPALMVGASVIAGLGGLALIEFFIAALREFLHNYARAAGSRFGGGSQNNGQYDTPTTVIDTAETGDRHTDQSS
jgi:hypothetical protein